MSAYDAFAAVYDDWASHVTEDVDFYVGLAREADGSIVELAVGNGRVAIPVAAATGARLVLHRSATASTSRSSRAQASRSGGRPAPNGRG